MQNIADLAFHNYKKSNQQPLALNQFDIIDTHQIDFT